MKTKTLLEISKSKNFCFGKSLVSSKHAKSRKFTPYFYCEETGLFYGYGKSFAVRKSHISYEKKKSDRNQWILERSNSKKLPYTHEVHIHLKKVYNFLKSKNKTVTKINLK